MVRVWVWLATLLVCCGLSWGLGVKFVNTLNRPIVLYWDSFRSSPEAKGLIFMGEIQPKEEYQINTHPTHVFEFQEFTGEPLDIAQMVDGTSTCIVADVRECGLHDDYNGPALVPELARCSAVLDHNVKRYRNTIVPRHRDRQTLDPQRSVLQEREKNEQRRIWLNNNQPKLTPKFTTVGYDYEELPDSAWKPLVEFWQGNKQRMELEKWKPQDHHVNHWESPTYVLFLPAHIQSAIIRVVQPILEKWIGGNTPLEYTALYGIRVYKNNSYLLNHVDRSATHAVSVIIQVDQKVDEDWMLEVIGHDGATKHLPLKPKQMILYESASVIHGRPEKMKGEFFANVFAHFRPKNNWNIKSL